MKFAAHMSVKLGIAAMALFGAACAEKETVQKPSTGKSTTNAVGEGGESPSSTNASDSLCKDMKANSALFSAHKSMVNDVCDSLVELRKVENTYRGGSTPKIIDSSKEAADKRSIMELYTSSVLDTTAEAYYKMTRMQMLEPSTFSSSGFESDSNIDYSIISKDTDSVTFKYYNDAETTVIVNYEAKSTFYELKSSDSDIKRYVVGTKLVKSLETVVALEGLIVINEFESSGKKYAEVFTMSNQTYDNNGDHAATLKKAKDNIGSEQIRSAKNAKTSRTFFKE